LKLFWIAAVVSILNHTSLPVPAGSAQLLRDLIHERLGVYFADSRLDSMLDKLDEPARARNCSSLMDYYHLLKYEENGHREWEHAMDALSVQETYFWREMSQIQALVEVLVPQWFKKQAGPLRIWSAACASGEEPYTIAIALHEAGWGDYPIEILASDASAAALAKAKRGVFRERSFRSLPPNLRDKYFQTVETGWLLKPAIQSRVKFSQANIVSKSEVRGLASAPIIFCRNVFIYFSSDAIRRAVAAFSSFIPAAGHLFVGASESLLKLSEDFELTEIRDAFVYVKKSPPIQPP
jgi:Methylase of chemotaxis methyl-accepting proteins